MASVFAIVAALPSPASAQSAADVDVRDNLIARQEALLNTYRCRFNIDTQVVPGGCSAGVPTRQPHQPREFAGTATAEEIAARDNLIAKQEALLNVYRCMFDIDTQLVPGGCEGTAGAYGYWQLDQDGAFTSYVLRADIRHGSPAALWITCYALSGGRSLLYMSLYVPQDHSLDGTITFDHANGRVLLQEWEVGLQFPETTMFTDGDENMIRLLEYLRQHRSGSMSVHLHGEDRVLRALFWIDGAAEAIAAIERVC